MQLGMPNHPLVGPLETPTAGASAADLLKNLLRKNNLAFGNGALYGKQDIASRRQFNQAIRKSHGIYGMLSEKVSDPVGQKDLLSPPTMSRFLQQ